MAMGKRGRQRQENLFIAKNTLVEISGSSVLREAESGIGGSLRPGNDTPRWKSLTRFHGFSVEDTPRFGRGGIDTACGGS